MKIKKLLLPVLFCGVTLAMAPALFAQDAPATSGSTAPAGGKGGGGRGFSVDDQLARLTKLLTLTDDEQAKIKPILQDQADKMKALFADTTVAKADRGAKMKTIRDDASTAIKALLTPDQVKIYEKMLADRAAGGGRRGGGNGGGAGGTTGGGQ